MPISKGLLHLIGILFILMLICLLINTFDAHYLRYLMYWIPSKASVLLILISLLFLNIRNVIIYYLREYVGILVFLVFEIFYVRIVANIDNVFFRGGLGMFSVVSFLKMLSYYWGRSELSSAITEIRENSVIVETVITAETTVDKNFSKRERPDTTPTLYSSQKKELLTGTNIPLYIYMRFTFLPTFVLKESFVFTRFSGIDLLNYMFQYFISQTLSILISTLFLYPHIHKVHSDLLANNLYLKNILLLIIYSIITWVLFFYTFFGCFIKTLSLVCLYDKPTYKSWWTCKSIREYWRLWNFQIYDFMRIYLVPRFSKVVALRNLKVFLFSAILHEYISVIMFGRILGVAFFGMFLQVLMMEIEKFMSWEDGNMFFWLFNCVFGQPVCLLLIYFILCNK
ncbi:Diacylglycerol O-acyltransferase 1 [Cucumispora dikerogammari]|nr:Diacylglycerol O-acyltransferase 1 [Cucumispora dikerogammari]